MRARCEKLPLSERKSPLAKRQTRPSPSPPHPAAVDVRPAQLSQPDVPRCADGGSRQAGAARGAASRAAPRGSDVVDVVRHVCGIQAQDARAARLSVRARCEGVTAADVDGAGLVRTWAWRGTLHLLARDDVPWVLHAIGPWKETARWRQLGLSEAIYARARKVVLEALPASRAELRERLGADGKGQRLPHLTARIAREGLLELRLDDTYAPLDSTPARGDELGRRYARAFGPATRRTSPSGRASAARRRPLTTPSPRRRRSASSPRSTPTCSATPTAPTSSLPSTRSASSPAGAGSAPRRARRRPRRRHLAPRGRRVSRVEPFDEPLPDLGAEIADVLRFLGTD